MKMIEKRIRKICESRGITTFYQLQKAAGFLSPSVAKALFEETYSRISDDTLNTLCETLECQPGDLMVYIPELPNKKLAGKKS